MKLRSKIHLYSSVLFALLFILTNLLVYIVFSRLSINEQLVRVESQTNKTADNIRQIAGSMTTAELLRAYVPVDGMIRIVTEKGNNSLVVTSSSEQELSKRTVTYSKELQAEKITYQANGYVFVSIPVIWTDGSVVNVQVTESLHQTENYLQVLRIVLITVTGIAMIPVILSGHILGRIIMRPIGAMTSTMSEIKRSGRFKRLALDPKSKDELLEMGQTFNAMIDLLETNYDKQKQFVSNASHELKTPLTIIESYASLLKRRGMDRPELFHESVDAIHSEAVRMKEMTEQLLLLAKHKEQWNLSIEPINLTEEVDELVKRFHNAYQRQINVKVTPELLSKPSLLVIQNDAGKLRQLLFILLDNARKYSEDHIVIELGEESPASDDSGTVTIQRRCIRIIDQGIGIPEAELSKVFDRFYRVDEARSRTDVGGSGLGLTLALEIADAIGATIRLESVEKKGTTAIVSLPTIFVSATTVFSANSNKDSVQ
ncbi:two-component system sensor histidine kinase ArlS [Paenibacillus sp. SORGH_AS306]|uniref:sensor histidine kinase n=1 Tax=unclassified Paenibacillus TaxID=185978 RepID=UPI002787628F|nr:MULTISPECIES: HAMP domain-containing sensor histidine kinase [unclassified Paenibacillus]MDQ1233943.1 two-component system sensor histidine kinase ArlS [Paenibacillus sp. SORGH_AS_0306]MDR6110988.1 two-component system sensor histidine kinase ArlS [Paenibacillus sp. SORGH_AS_0338]